MRASLLTLALLMGCQARDESVVTMMIPPLRHRCDSGEVPLARGQAALSETQLDPGEAAPTTPWVIEIDWLEPGHLEDRLRVDRSVDPSELLALDVAFPVDGCADGAVLDARYEATFATGTRADAGSLWTRSDPDHEVQFVEATWALPLDQAPPAVQRLAAQQPVDERAVSEVIFTLLDRPLRPEATWVLQRTHGYTWPGRDWVETPRQWLLARGTWRTVQE